MNCPWKILFELSLENLILWTIQKQMLKVQTLKTVLYRFQFIPSRVLGAQH